MGRSCINISGNATKAVNVGSGCGVYAGKSGIGALEFKSLSAVDSSISVTCDGDNIYFQTQALGAGAENGLTLCNNNVTLGGTLTGTTAIIGNNKNFSVTGAADMNMCGNLTKIYGDFAMLVGSDENVSMALVCDGDSGCQSGIGFNQFFNVIQDGVLGCGISYLTDYSKTLANTAPRWIPDAAWVTGNTGGGGGGINMSGSTVDGLTTYVDGDTICAHDNLRWTGAVLEFQSGSSKSICMNEVSDGAEIARDLSFIGQCRTGFGANCNAGSVSISGGYSKRTGSSPSVGGTAVVIGGQSCSEDDSRGGSVVICGGDAFTNSSGDGCGGNVLIMGGIGDGAGGNSICGCVSLHFGNSQRLLTTAAGMKFLNMATCTTETRMLFLDLNGNVTCGPISGGGGSGTVTSVAAGNGLDFTTITTTGSVTLGTPSTLTLATTNSVGTTTHCHALSIANFGTSAAGLAPASGGGTTNFLRADGIWAAAGGSGGIAVSGTTNNALTTYINATGDICAEPNITFDGSSLEFGQGATRTICVAESTDGGVGDGLNVYAGLADGGGGGVGGALALFGGAGGTSSGTGGVGGALNICAGAGGGGSTTGAGGNVNIRSGTGLASGTVNICHGTTVKLQTTTYGLCVTGDIHFPDGGNRTICIDTSTGAGNILTVCGGNAASNFLGGGATIRGGTGGAHTSIACCGGYGMTLGGTGGIGQGTGSGGKGGRAILRGGVGGGADAVRGAGGDVEICGGAGGEGTGNGGSICLVPSTTGTDGRLIMCNLPTKSSETCTVFIDGSGNLSTGGVGGVSATNGVCVDGDNVVLGGSLTGDTTITTTGFDCFRIVGGGNYLQVATGETILVNQVYPYLSSLCMDTNRIQLLSIDLAAGGHLQYLETDPANDTIKLGSGNGSGTNGILCVNYTEMSIQSNYSTFAGIEYCADYKLNYSSRSLVDKAYVDSIAGGLEGRTEGASTWATVLGCEAFSGNSHCNTAIGFKSLIGVGSSLGCENTAVGFRSGTGIVVGCQNVAIGVCTMQSGGDGSGGRSVAIGYRALNKGACGHRNLAIGECSMGGGALLATGQNNTAVGRQTLYSVTSASDNVAIGSYASRATTTAYDSISIGTAALIKNTTGNRHIAIGCYALCSMTGNTGVCGDIAIGSAAGASLTGGILTNNVFIGNIAGCSVNAASRNVMIGDQAGCGKTTGNDNIMIGYRAGSNMTTGALNVMIGCGVGLNVTGGGNLLIGYSPTTHLIRGCFTNNCICNGGNCTTWDQTSDCRIKENINTVSNATSTLSQLNPVTFDYTTGYTEMYSWKENKRVDNYGFIAQEFETVFPNFVGSSEEGYISSGTSVSDFRTMNSGHLVPILVKAIQELEARIDVLESQ